MAWAGRHVSVGLEDGSPRRLVDVDSATLKSNVLGKPRGSLKPLLTFKISTCASGAGPPPTVPRAQQSGAQTWRPGLLRSLGELGKALGWPGALMPCVCQESLFGCGGGRRQGSPPKTGGGHAEPGVAQSALYSSCLTCGTGNATLAQRSLHV